MQGKYLKEKFPAVKPAEKAKYPTDLNGAIVGPIPAFTGGVKVDLQGNVYLGMAVRKRGWQPLPSLSRDEIYKRWTGSVLKFDPKAGGAILGLKDSESLQPDIPRIELEQKLIAEGALCSYAGISPYSGGGPGGNTSGCVCRVPRFDVDRFGRVALPGALAANAVLHDNNGNLIATIGAYGNFDSQYVVEGRKSPDITVPAIPVAWPTSVGFSRDNLYICDGANRRIVRVKLEWELEQEVVIK
jgi:hypothetical protein